MTNTIARAGIADGAIEPYDFTDIDRTVAVGGQLDGRAWGSAVTPSALPSLTPSLHRISAICG